MNCKYLRRIEGFAEHVDGSQLPTEHSVGVRRLRGAQEALIITLQGKHGRVHFKFGCHKHIRLDLKTPNESIEIKKKKDTARWNNNI